MHEPTLTVNMAMTLDGKVMLPDGTWHGLTSATDRKTMDEYRARAQALIVGRNSVEKDNPVFALKDGRPGPRPVMICRSRLHRPDLRFFQHEPILYTSPALAESAEGHNLSKQAEVVCAVELEPTSIIRDLSSRGYNRLLLEGGPALNAAFFRLDLVDTLHITIVPYILGDSSLPGIVDSDSCLPDFKERSWKLVRCERIENEIFTEYRRQRK